MDWLKKESGQAESGDARGLYLPCFCNVSSTGRTADYNQPAVLLHSAADVPFYCAACVAIASILPPVADAAKAVPTFARLF